MRRLLTTVAIVSLLAGCKKHELFSNKTSPAVSESTGTAKGAPMTPEVESVWQQKASKFEGPAGSRFTLSCSGSPQTANVWGTDIYTDDSSICTAALHAGLIDAKGGSVTFEIRNGENEYIGTQRHDVTTQNYPAWGRSFVFIGKDGKAIEPVRSTVRLATWALTPSLHRTAVSGHFTYVCPANGAAGTVWGSDVYTDDTSICSAAVHAGKITAGDGGVVTIEMRPGQQSYESSERNGVKSTTYGSWGGSFVFVDTPPELQKEAETLLAKH